jgi:hypothetical protein
MTRIRVDAYTGVLSGRKGDVTARFERLPYYVKDGKKRFAHPDFGSELIGVLYEVMPPEPKRLFFGAGKCQTCGTQLPEQPRPHAFSLRLEIDGLEPINLTVELPAVACPACGTQHRTGGRDVESDLSDAMIAAFQVAGLTY